MLKLIVPLKMTLMCVECNNEKDNDDDDSEKELMIHYNKFKLNFLIDVTNVSKTI